MSQLFDGLKVDVLSRSAMATTVCIRSNKACCMFGFNSSSSGNRYGATLVSAILRKRNSWWRNKMC